MKIKTILNNENFTIAEVKGIGHLGVHINMRTKVNDSMPEMSIFTSGYSTNNPEITEYYDWKKSKLNAGDILKIELMPSNEADDPISVKRSTESKSTFNTTSEQADKILQTGYDCKAKLILMLRELESELCEEEYRKISYAVGALNHEIFGSLEQPIYRKYPSKKPDELKDLPL